jgi:hypothetical protein
MVFHFSPRFDPDCRGEITEPPFSTLACSSTWKLIGNSIPWERTSTVLHNFEEFCIFFDGERPSKRGRAMESEAIEHSEKAEVSGKGRSRRSSRGKGNRRSK